MNEKTAKVFRIPAEEIRQDNENVVITFRNKKIIICDSEITGLAEKEKFCSATQAQIFFTQSKTLVEPIISEQNSDYEFTGSSTDFSSDTKQRFKVNEIVNVLLVNPSIRNHISSGNYAFYCDNLIPSYWQFLSKSGLDEALKKITASPIIKKVKVEDTEIYELDDYARTINVLSCTNVDDIISKYSMSIRDYITFGKALNTLMNEKNISLIKLTQMTGIDKTSIHCYIHDTRIPNLNYATAICIALRLSYLQSIQLLALCDITLMRDTRQNILLRFFLDSSLFESTVTVSWCNEFLIDNAMQPLTRLRKIKE